MSLPEALRELRGLPDPQLHPPQVAASGDPWSMLRVVDLVARIPRGAPVRVRDLVDRLNALYVDWSFSRRVVLDTIIQLQANWMADYRNSSGIVLTEGPVGPELTIEDSPRVDPWIVGQAQRIAAECRARSAAFAREEGAIP